MKSRKEKNSPQMGPGQAGESHTDSSVCPQRNMGGDTQLPTIHGLSAAPSARPAATAPTTLAATHAPPNPLTDTLTAATHAPTTTTTTQSVPSTGAWQQSLVRKSITNNPDNDKDNARLSSLGDELRALALQREKIDTRLKDTDLKTPRKDDEPGSSVSISANEVRLLRKKRGKLVARERELNNRMRKIREGSGQRDVYAGVEGGVRDQPLVREGTTQREKRPDAETSGSGQIREGVTQRETPRTAPEPPGSVIQDKTDATPRDRPRPRKRGKRAGLLRRTNMPLSNSSQPQPGPSGLSATKRTRPDDTASPNALQGDPKRVRVQTAQGEQRTYARASKDIPARLAVAICYSPPSRDMTQKEADLLKTELERLIMDADPTEPLPAFRGYPRVAEGTLQMWCEDDRALTWLHQKVPNIKLPDTDLTLTVMRQSDVPTRVRAALFVPRYNGDIAKLQEVLIRQNYWYDIGKWSLYKATAVGGDNHGTYLTLGIPPDEVQKVLERERRISYFLGSIYVRFYPPTQPIDAQAGSTDTEQTGPTTRTDTDPDQDEMARLEEGMAKAAMADATAAPPASPGWNEALLASSPNNPHAMEEEGSTTDGSISP